MKTRKTVTDKVIEANRGNSNRSTGPKTARGKENAKLNATTHGMLAKTLRFANDEERAAYDLFHNELNRQIQPGDWIESMLVEEIATNYWKLPAALKWEGECLTARREITRSLIAALTLNNSWLNGEEQSLLDDCEEALNRTSTAWECAELCVQTSHSGDSSQRVQQDTEPSEDNSGRSQPRIQPGTMRVVHALRDQGRVQTTGGYITVKLSSSPETIMRYKTQIKRDLYRAIELLDRRRAKGSEGE